MRRWGRRGRMGVVAAATFVLLALVLPQVATGIGLGSLAASSGSGASCGSSGSGASGGSGSSLCGPLMITASPDTKLVDTQSVTVTGTGFPAYSTVNLAQCKAGATGQDGCDVSTESGVGTNGSGAFVTTFRVSRLIYTTSASGTSVTTDCALAPCMLGAADATDMAVAAVTPLSFNRKVPPVFEATLDPTDEVHGSTGVADIAGRFVCRQPVTVFLYVFVDQHQGRFNNESESYSLVGCHKRRSWKVAVEPGLLLFAPGKATVSADLSVQYPDSYRDIPLSATVKLVAAPGS